MSRPITLVHHKSKLQQTCDRLKVATCGTKRPITKFLLAYKKIKINKIKKKDLKSAVILSFTEVKFVIWNLA